MRARDPESSLPPSPEWHLVLLLTVKDPPRKKKTSTPKSYCSEPFSARVDKLQCPPCPMLIPRRSMQAPSSTINSIWRTGRLVCPLASGPFVVASMLRSIGGGRMGGERASLLRLPFRRKVIMMMAKGPAIAQWLSCHSAESTVCQGLSYYEDKSTQGRPSEMSTDRNVGR